MIERAEWRRRAGGPTTALGIVLGADRWRGVPTWLLVLGASIVWGFAVEILALPDGFVGIPLVLVTLLGKVKSPERSVAPEPLPEGTYPVRVALKRRWRTLGEDAGTVAFVDGWLVFEGEETSFSVAPKDVAQSDLHSILLTDGTRIVLKPTLASGLGMVSAAMRGGTMPLALSAWRASSPSEGGSRLPPRSRQVSRIYRAAGWCEFGALGFFGYGLGDVMGTLVRDGSMKNLLVLLTALAVASAFPAVAAQVLVAWAARKERRMLPSTSELP